MKISRIGAIAMVFLLCMGNLAKADIFSAARKGDLSDVSEAIKLGVDINAKDQAGWTPLMYAAIGNHYEASKKLLENGARVTVVDRKGFCVLDYLDLSDDMTGGFKREGKVQETDPRLIALLKEAAGKERWVADLVAAIERGDREATGKLLANNYNVNAKDKDGRWPFYVAVSAADIAACRLLLNRGANLETKDEGKHTVYDLVRSGAFKMTIQQRSDMLTLLERAYVDREKADIQRSSASIPGFDINALGADGLTPLMRAALKGNYRGCQALVELGADVMVRDGNGKTVYDYICVKRGDEDTKQRIRAILDLAKKGK